LSAELSEWSADPEYQAYERIAEEVNVVGRVVWAARRL
jgi:hypothetical protein